VALKRKAAQQEKGVEKPVYGVESQQGVLLALPALLWLLPQLVGKGGPWGIVPAILLGIFVAWGGIASVIGSTSWYRLGLDSSLIALSGVGRTSRVLNAVCGTGSLAISCGKAIGSGEVVATDTWKPTKRVPDPSKRTRDNIRIEGVDHIVRVQEADPLFLPFKAGYFNVVGSRYGIGGSRKDRRKILIEMLRVMKPGGRLVLAEALPVALWLRYRVLPPLVAQYKVNDVRLSRFRFTLIVSAQKLG
jgi:SAM-dependent methyltransferase